MPLALLAIVICVLPASVAMQAGQVQTAPITEPRGQEEQSAPIVKGAKAVTEQHEKCATRLRVDADALFRPHRWTLNPDAWETLDVLGPMIAKAGKHPARIVAYTGAADSESENRDVSERRALTVRTWLVNNNFLPAGTPLEGVGAVREAAPAESSSAHDSRRSSPATAEHNNGSVDILMEICR
jgi:outer membrane protein OmpA-like peptidoglycan-associated protein